MAYNLDTAQTPKINTMDSVENVDSEKMSLLLSEFLEREFTGTQEEMEIIKRASVLTQEEQVTQTSQGTGTYMSIVPGFRTGSKAEGLYLQGSDSDYMIVNPFVIVLNPGQSIPPNMTHNTTLYMREANCRQGYVRLQLGRRGHMTTQEFLDSLVSIGGSTFVSSDIYRERKNINLRTRNTHLGMNWESNGPSCCSNKLEGGIDIVFCFPCPNWPKEANEWVTRPRLYGWPEQTLIDSIVLGGCHLVPVGDKCSGDTLLQWRISFAKAEAYLVHSFNHIQVKVYALLKYFLKQIKQTLKDTMGDDDILCSYFLKTIIFHATENSHQLFWQEKNLLFCFWFCFNILIAWVRAGVCPNYFFPGNNMFQRKVHGLHQQVLLDILNTYCQMKWKCLSIGNFFKTPIWEILCGNSIQALVRPKTAQENVFQRDVTIATVLSVPYNPNLYFRLTNIRKLIQQFLASKSDFDEVLTYHRVMKGLQFFATTQSYQNRPEESSNKAKYKRLRKCKRWMMNPITSMGTEVLHLATFHFVSGKISRALEMCNNVMELAKCWLSTSSTMLSSKRKEMLRHLYGQYGQTLDRLKNIYTGFIVFQKQDLYPPHLCLEIQGQVMACFIPPLPYTLFLTFLCFHELGDTTGRDAALQHLIKVQSDGKQGGQEFWIVHTLLGICFQVLGDTRSAITAYWDSAQSQGWNTGIKRIALVYLCIYASQMSKTG